MVVFQRLGLSSLLFGLQFTVAFADGPPKLDVSISCNGASRLTGRDKEACLLDEGAGRRALTKNWSKYSTEDKMHCVTHVQTGRAPSYVELLSCLDTLRDAKGFRDGDRIMVETDQSKQSNSRPAEWGPDGLPLTGEPPPPLPYQEPPAPQPCPNAPAAFAALPSAVAGWLCLGMRPRD
jgi:hypothetical protein